MPKEKQRKNYVNSFTPIYSIPFKRDCRDGVSGLGEWKEVKKRKAEKLCLK